MDAEVGKTHDKSDVKIMIKKIQTKKLKKAGYKNIIDKSICDTSVRNYSALLANEGNIAISQSYMSKSNTKILIAFECRQIKNSIGDILPYDTDITSDTSMADHLRVFTVSLGEGNSVLPSKLLSDKRWVRFVHQRLSYNRSETFKSNLRLVQSIFS